MKRNIVRARHLRANQTDAETKMWFRLRARRLEGHKFRRQVPIDRYIVDFLCEEKKLIVEIDGGQHGERIEYDAERTKVLEGAGYIVVRYWNNEVLGNIEGVLEDLRSVLDTNR